LSAYSQSQTTARCAHFAADPAIEVADKISERLAIRLNSVGIHEKGMKLDSEYELISAIR
jgi:hypothetical protein